MFLFLRTLRLLRIVASHPSLTARKEAGASRPRSRQSLDQPFVTIGGGALPLPLPTPRTARHAHSDERRNQNDQKLFHRDPLCRIDSPARTTTIPNTNLDRALVRKSHSD